MNHSLGDTAEEGTLQPCAAMRALRRVCRVSPSMFGLKRLDDVEERQLSLALAGERERVGQCVERRFRKYMGTTIDRRRESGPGAPFPGPLTIRTGHGA